MGIPTGIPARYAEFYRLGLLGGQTDAALRNAIAEMVNEDVLLADGRCPRCGGGVVRDLDPNQSGTTQATGTWFRYRCACGFLSARIEPG